MKQLEVLCLEWNVKLHELQKRFTQLVAESHQVKIRLPLTVIAQNNLLHISKTHAHFFFNTLAARLLNG